MAEQRRLRVKRASVKTLGMAKKAGRRIEQTPRVMETEETPEEGAARAVQREIHMPGAPCKGLKGRKSEPAKKRSSKQKTGAGAGRHGAEKPTAAPLLPARTIERNMSM